YFVYLVTLYWLIDRLKLVPSLLGATFFWAVSAAILIAIWNKA
ncbi:MAG: GlpM family protein, partial [Anaerolineae bacterium]|nr:GlpM family protein [Anaerolineae bacterium]